MPAKEAFRCFRGFCCFRDSVGAPWNRDFVDFVEIVLFVGYRETVEIVDFVAFVVFGGYRETVEIVETVGFVCRYSILLPSVAPLGQRGREGRNKPALPVAETAGLFLAQCSRFPKQALACAGKMG